VVTAPVPDTTRAPVSVVPDTTTHTVVDTAQLKPIVADSIKPKPAEHYTFRVVFKETVDLAAAKARMKELISRNHKVIMYTRDSLFFKLAEPFSLPLSDTGRIKDSLNKYYYNGKAYIELR
jgi:hypothetical protein